MTAAARGRRPDPAGMTDEDLVREGWELQRINDRFVSVRGEIEVRYLRRELGREKDPVRAAWLRKCLKGDDAIWLLGSTARHVSELTVRFQDAVAAAAEEKYDLGRYSRMEDWLLSEVRSGRLLEYLRGVPEAERAELLLALRLVISNWFSPEEAERFATQARPKRKKR